MKKVIVGVMFTVIFFGTVVISLAERGDWRGGIRARIHQAHERIERGIDRGSLTRPEAQRLKRELDGILHKIDRMKDDGHLSPREREIINRDLDKLDRDISREKHDRERRRR
jgi:hypothetical protein